jgi:hypothetical protein
MPNTDRLAEFTMWCQSHVTGDEAFRSGTAAQISSTR